MRYEACVGTVGNRRYEKRADFGDDADLHPLLYRDLFAIICVDPIKKGTSSECITCEVVNKPFELCLIGCLCLESIMIGPFVHEVEAAIDGAHTRRGCAESAVLDHFEGLVVCVVVVEIFSVMLVSKILDRLLNRDFGVGLPIVQVQIDRRLLDMPLVVVGRCLLLVKTKASGVNGGHNRSHDWSQSAMAVNSVANSCCCDVY